jgi:hypothetical protein
MKNKIQQEQTKRTKTEKENIRFLRYLLFKLRCRVVSPTGPDAPGPCASVRSKL